MFKKSELRAASIPCIQSRELPPALFGHWGGGSISNWAFSRRVNRAKLLVAIVFTEQRARNLRKEREYHPVAGGLL